MTDFIKQSFAILYILCKYVLCCVVQLYNILYILYYISYITVCVQYVYLYLNICIYAYMTANMYYMYQIKHTE